MIRNQPFSLLAGGADSISIRGSYVYWASAAGADQRLRVKTPRGDEVDFEPGTDLTFDQEVDRLDIQNLGSSALSGVLVVGNGRVQKRLVSGVVSVSNLTADQLVHFGSAQHVLVDQEAGLQRAIAGQSFAACSTSSSAAAVSIYLVNPVGSGKTVALRRSSLFPRGAYTDLSVVLWTYSGGTLTAGSTVCVNKKAGGAAAVAILNPSVFTPTGNSQKGSIKVTGAQSATLQEWTPADEVILPSGSYLEFMMNKTAGNTADICCEWVEL